MRLKFFHPLPMRKGMTISNVPTSLLDSVLTAQTTQADAGIAVLKKAQDTMKQQGEAEVQMLEQAGVQGSGQAKPLLDSYA